MKYTSYIISIFVILFGFPYYVLVGGYTLQGPSWSCSDVSGLGWFVLPRSNYRTYIINSLTAADDHWNGVVKSTPVLIPWFYKSPSRSLAEIIIKSRDKGDNRVLATTRLVVNGNRIVKVYITVNSYYLENGYYLSNEHFYFVLNHELGHALGLGHNNLDDNVLMYPTDRPYRIYGIFYPVTDDIEGVTQLYGIC